MAGYPDSREKKATHRRTEQEGSVRRSQIQRDTPGASRRHGLPTGEDQLDAYLDRLFGESDRRDRQA